MSNESIRPKESVRLLLIAAMERSRGIGKNNDLPWHLPNETAYYTRLTIDTRDKTKQNVVILGRRTWESMPPEFHPLPSRVNIVLSRDVNYTVPKGVYLAASVGEAISLTQSDQLRNRIENIWILGGEGVYRETLRSPLCHRIYLTHVDADYDCDTFFPEFNCPGDFKEVEDDRVPKGLQEENGIKWLPKVFERVV